jgi:peptidoglycan/xylan/chitin deacetylase (PgdA/CDA1 family)
LQQAGAPATVFVASSYMGDSVEFWWDELERVLLQTGTVPPLLEMRIADRRYRWNLVEDAHYDAAALRARSRLERRARHAAHAAA